jgi:hypothetical protein
MSRFAAMLSGQIGSAGQVVALDGKSLRGALDTAKRTPAPASGDRLGGRAASGAQAESCAAA